MGRPICKERVFRFQLVSERTSDRKAAYLKYVPVAHDDEEFFSPGERDGEALRLEHDSAVDALVFLDESDR